MIFLQIIEEVSEKAFSINPDTVYAFLVGVLFLANVAQTIAVIYLNKQNNVLIKYIAEEMAATAESIARLLERVVK